MAIVNYGMHAVYTHAGNVIRCEFCSRLAALPAAERPLGPDEVWCGERERRERRGGHCFAFVREVGSDDA